MTINRSMRGTGRRISRWVLVTLRTSGLQLRKDRLNVSVTLDTTWLTVSFIMGRGISRISSMLNLKIFCYPYPKVFQASLKRIYSQPCTHSLVGVAKGTIWIGYRAGPKSNMNWAGELRSISAHRSR